jgi:SAM-dependent methyltransferase
MRSILSISPSAAASPSEAPAPKRCDLCGCDQFEVLSRLDRRRQPLVTEVCTRCGLVSHQKIPTEEELAAFYATEYRWQYHREITPSPRRVMRAWRNGQRIYRQVAPWLAPRSRVLEIGAGIGCTVKVFEQEGHDATGIEPNDGFQTYSRQRLRAEVTRHYLADLPPQPINDLVLLVHVIEHFRSPRTAMEQLHKLIRPGGLLYVECPNLGAVATREKTFHFAHIHNFTPGTLMLLARHTGFEVENWFVQPHAPILQVLLRRVAQPHFDVPAGSNEQTLAAFHRYGFLSYYLRGEYLASRCVEVLDKAWELAAAPAYLRRILASCALSPSKEQSTTAASRRRAA